MRHTSASFEVSFGRFDLPLLAFAYLWTITAPLLTPPLGAQTLFSSSVLTWCSSCAASRQTDWGEVAENAWTSALKLLARPDWAARLERELAAISKSIWPWEGRTTASGSLPASPHVRRASSDGWD